MRNLSTEPITVQEVKETLQVHADDAHLDGIGNPGGVALDLLASFLKKPVVEGQLLAHLEEKQPKVMDRDLEELDLQTVATLYKTVRHWDTIYRYAGMSPRGSHVYELFPELHMCFKNLYVRRVNGELQAQLNEDDFTKPGSAPSPEPEGRKTRWDRLKATVNSWLEQLGKYEHWS